MVRLLTFALAAAERTTWRVHFDTEELPGRQLTETVGPSFVDTKEVPFNQMFYPHGMMDTSTGHVLTELPPWSVDANPRAKIYRSKQVSREFATLFNKQAPGLDATYLEVFMALERGLCIPYVIGGEVRDLLWSKKGLDVDISFTCSTNQITAIARQNDWPVFTYPAAGYMRLGAAGSQDPIEGKEATGLTAPAWQQEFVCNSLLYDVGINQAIIDRFGQGVEDDFNRIIRIPGDESEWPAWAEEGNGLKLVRFFKLRAAPKSFTAEPRTGEFVLSEIKRRMEQSQYKMQMTFAHQLSHFLLGLDADAAAEKLSALRDVMIEDLGQTWYDTYVKPVEPSVGQPPVMI